MYRKYGQKTAPAFFAYQPSMAIYAAGAGSAGAAMNRKHIIKKQLCFIRVLLGRISAIPLN
jgi:hypothetical protein